MQASRIQTFLIGIAMGTADIIPGVSGGTIAFISGIYDKLVASIAHIDKQFFMWVFRGQRKKARNHINGGFLLQLFSGIIIAIISIAKLMTVRLEHYPLQVFSLFFGLICASLLIIAHQSKLIKHPVLIYRTLGGILLGYVATSSFSGAIQTHPSLLFLFFSGCIASMAMILPGISGSYILVILHMYEYVLGLIDQQTDLVITAFQQQQLMGIFGTATLQIGVFVVGIATGLLGFSKLLQRLLQHYKQQTLALLVGIMLGAMHTIWPWTSTDLTTYQRLSSIGFVVIGTSLVLFLFLSATKKSLLRKPDSVVDDIYLAPIMLEI